MFLVIEGGNKYDITILTDKTTLIAHLNARTIAGVDIDKEIDIYPIDLASRIKTKSNIILQDEYENF